MIDLNKHKEIQELLEKYVPKEELKELNISDKVENVIKYKIERCVNCGEDLKQNNYVSHFSGSGNICGGCVRNIMKGNYEEALVKDAMDE